MTGETGTTVKKMLKVIRTGSSEGIIGDAKDQQAEELGIAVSWEHCG